MSGKRDTTKLRSDAELQAQGEGLALIRDVLREHGLQYMISDGTLLGALREEDFINWDWDAEMFLFHDEVKHRTGDLLRALRSRGFKIVKVQRRRKAWKITLRKDGGFEYELRAWSADGEHYVRDGFRIPRRLMEGRREVSLRGETYAAPLRSEEYLDHVYGDWRTPVRSSEKDDYLTEDFRPPETRPHKILHSKLGKLRRRFFPDRQS